MKPIPWCLPAAVVALLALATAAWSQEEPAPEPFTIEKVNANISKYAGRTVIFQDVLMSGKRQKYTIRGWPVRFLLSVRSTAGKWFYPSSYINGDLTFEISPDMADKLADDNLMATMSYHVNLVGRIQKMKNELGWNWALAIHRIDYRDKDGKVVKTITAEPPQTPPVR